MFLLFLIGCTCPVVYGQIDWGKYSQSAPNGVMDQSTAIGIIVCIPKDNNSFWVANDNSKYFDQLGHDTAFLNKRSDNVVARTTFDDNAVHFFAHGIDKTNATLYQFRVMEYPDRVVEPWQPLSRFTDSAVIKSSGMPQMAYLGGYKARLSNLLVIDVRRIGQGKITATALVAWERIRPVVTNIYTSGTFDAFLQRLQYPWSNQSLAPRALPKQDMRLSKDNINVIFFLKADIYHRQQVQYQLLRDDKVAIPWRDNNYDNSFIWLKETRPGKYTLNIRYRVQPAHIATWRFEVEPAWYQSGWFLLSAALLIVVLAGAIIFLILLFIQRRFSQQEQNRRQAVQLELRAVRAQLNPHFVFNALSSIQGLINKKDVRAANAYLSSFASLMRESLKSSDSELYPLEKEIAMLDTYLQLERLRFGFTYEITITPDVNIYETAVPSLLIQPLVENAVKHGVAGLQHGTITITIQAKEDGLTVIIIDNGKGFATGEATEGYGLKLTRDRIALLNRLDALQQIDLQINSDAQGTIITLTFNHWLS